MKCVLVNHYSLIRINDRQIEQVTCIPIPGVTISNNLMRQFHIHEITAKAGQCLYNLYFIILFKQAGVEPHHLIKIYTTIIRSVTEYACQVWHMSLTKRKSCSKTYRNGPCAVYFVECVIMTQSPQQDYQPWQTGGRRFADLCSRA